MTELSVKILTASFSKASQLVPSLATKRNVVKTKRDDYQRKFMKLENLFLVLLCITALMVPSLGAVCGVTDGSAANSVACTCGSVECTSTTGFICYSTYGGGSCRKSGLGAFAYLKEAGNTNCGSMRNRYRYRIKPILDKAACEAAATSMDLNDVVATEVSYDNLINHLGRGRSHPPGCFWFGNNLYYNTLSTSTQSCTSNSDFCLCVTAPDCTQTNGATSNAAPCYCGPTDGTVVLCTAASGLYCYSSHSLCATAPVTACASTFLGSSQSVPSPVFCTCSQSSMFSGTVNVCTASTGLFCKTMRPMFNIMVGSCSGGDPCTSTSGVSLNTIDCTCGTANCNSFNGRYCVGSSNVCVKACPLGQYRNLNTIECQKCPTGQYSDGAGSMAQCKACSAGKWADQTGL